MQAMLVCATMFAAKSDVDHHNNPSMHDIQANASLHALGRDVAFKRQWGKYNLSCWPRRVTLGQASWRRRQWSSEFHTSGVK